MTVPATPETPPPANPGPALRPLLRAHGAELVRLAAPTMVQRGGVLAMSVVDTLMVGNFSATELAYQAMGMVPFAFIMLFLLGGLMGGLVVTSNAFGAGDLAACGAAWRRGVPYATLLGVGGFVFCLFGAPLLSLFGQSDELAREGGRVAAILGIALPFLLMTVAGGYFLEGIKRPMPGMVIMIAANGVNIIANWVLVFGAGPVPAMGAEGSAIATATVWALQALAVNLYIRHMQDRDRFGLLRPVAETWRGYWLSGARQRMLGYAAGGSMGTENAAFMGMQLMAGLMGPIALGAYAVTFNAFAVAFMLSIGIGTATAVRVGYYFGQRDRAQMTLAGWVGLAFNIAVMLVMGTLLIVFARPIASAYGDEAALVTLAASLIAFIGIILPLDTAQTVMASALRGMGETWVPTGFHMVSYFGVMLPFAAWLGLGLGRGPLGLLEAMLIASVVSTAFMCWRFHMLAKRGGAGGYAR